MEIAVDGGTVPTAFFGILTLWYNFYGFPTIVLLR